MFKFIVLALAAVLRFRRQLALENDGIILDAAVGVTVGGTASGAGNVISGNLDVGNEADGIWITGGSGHIIQGNHLGTDATASLQLGNINAGITLTNSSGNLIGGTADGAGNVIAHNGNYGVNLQSSGTGNSILGNAIHGNGGLGIDRYGDDVTDNDGGDGDGGINEQRNFPEITAATASGGTVDVDFELDVPVGDYRIEFFRNPGGVDATNGEGEDFAAAVTVSHGGTGIETFSHSFDGAAGETLTATTTDSIPAGGYASTSEFSTWHVVTVAPTYQVAGIVFEDTDFAGAATDWDSGAGDVALANVDVELYGAADAYIASTSTAADGTFSFTGLADGTYKIRARSATVGDADTAPADGLHITVPAIWPYPLAEMTWAHDSALIGGQDPAIDDTATGDDAGPGDTWVTVTVSGGDVTGVNFGFCYEIIINDDDDANADNVRSKQGTLRQFIKNSNAIVGVNKSWFQIPAP